MVRDSRPAFLVDLFRGLRGIEGLPVELAFDPDRSGQLRCRPPSAGARERALPRGRLIRLSPASPVLSTRPVYRPRASRRCPIEHTGKTSDFRCWIPRV